MPGPWGILGGALALPNFTKPPLQLAFLVPPGPAAPRQKAHFSHPQTSLPGVWGWARELRHIPSGTKRFFSSHDRFGPASPTSHSGQGWTQRSPYPRGEKPETSNRAEGPAWPAREAWDGIRVAGGGGCATRIQTNGAWGSQPCLPPAPHNQNSSSTAWELVGTGWALPQVSHLPNYFFIVSQSHTLSRLP